MKTKYAFEEQEDMAKAYGSNLGISTKVSIEIANHLRGRSTSKAKAILENVLKKKEAIPFKRFTDGVGHRKGQNIAAGRYPQKATQEFLGLIKQAEANAQNKGLGEELKIIHLAAHKAGGQRRPGRHGSREFKRTHLEIAVKEQVKQKTKQKESKKPNQQKQVEESKND